MSEQFDARAYDPYSPELIDSRDLIGVDRLPSKPRSMRAHTGALGKW